MFARHGLMAIAVRSVGIGLYVAIALAAAVVVLSWPHPGASG
jgi:hypothetical protein